jgi:3-hydroxyisobutyrate dehydrogenase-like beta-hydroxyacid dehydrogenase
MAAAKASVGIISIGEMGLGIAKLLQSKNYAVLTNVSDRRSVVELAVSNAYM